MANIELKGLKGLLDLSSNTNLENKSNELSLLNEKLVHAPLNSLLPGKYQPRRNFNEEALNSLAISIKENGIIQPIIVRELDNCKYEIIAGERRWRAAQLVGMQEVPIIIKKVSNETAIAFSLIENIQRADLNPLEQAQAFFRLVKEFFLTHEKISEIVGFSRSTISNYIRLLNLSTPVKELIQTGKLEIGHAKALLVLNESQQIEVASKISKSGLTVRQTEKIVLAIKKNELIPSKEKVNLDLKLDIIVRRVIQKFNYEVTLKIINKKPKLIFKLKSLKELDKLVEELCD